MTFDELNLNAPLLNALDDMGLKHPTTIQAKSFAPLMSGKDVVGIAQTGTGKTIAYLLPFLRLWKYRKDRYPEVLILVPTRELVVQVVEEIKKLTAYMNVEVVGVYGGTNIRTQTDDVNRKLDIVVATPGRLYDIALTGVLRLKSIKRLIIDEVDEMLNLGFLHQLIRIFDLLPEKRQNLMFSATMIVEVENLIKEFFNHPQKIEAAPTGTPLENIVQKAYAVPNFYTKVNLLELLLTERQDMNKVLVFTDTKKLADQLFEQISKKFSDQIGVIHSNKAQNNRFRTVNRFQDGSYRMIIATDIVARGLDVSEVSHVINFDMPEIAETYMHRIGRTGRADKKGIALSFVTPREKNGQDQIEDLMKNPIPMESLPEGLVISEVLTEDEKPKVYMREAAPVKLPPKEEKGPAFHEKKPENLKTSTKITRKESYKIKYKKPKTRGQKNK
jgi:ATP-dependent RNA helicase RhlE